MTYERKYDTELFDGNVKIVSSSKYVPEPSIVQEMEEIEYLPAQLPPAEHLKRSIIGKALVNSQDAYEALETSLSYLKVVEPHSKFARLLRDISEYIDHIEVMLDAHSVPNRKDGRT